MKIKVTIGCICDNFTVDSKSASDLSKAELSDCCEKIINNIDNKEQLIKVFIECVSICGDYDENKETYFFKSDKLIELVEESDFPNPRNCDYDFTKKYHYREYLTIDGEDMSNLTLEEIKSHLNKLLYNASKNEKYSILIQLTEDLGVVEYVDHCSECGDDIYTYTYEIN